MILLNEYVNM